MKKVIIFILSIVFLSCGSYSLAIASSYNQGIYNENIPYGSATYIAISADGDISLGVIPTSSGVQTTNTSNVTVTSTDVVGFKLYIRSDTTTDMTNPGGAVPASSNVVPAPLSINTWGYNVDGSGNFIGSSLTNTLIRSFTGPAVLGDTTTVTYGVKIDLAKPAGNYKASIVYTAVPEIN